MEIRGDIGKDSPLRSVNMAAGDFIVIGDAANLMTNGMIRADGDISFNPAGNSWLENTGVATYPCSPRTTDHFDCGRCHIR